MITYYKSTDDLIAYIKYQEARKLELERESRSIREELAQYYGRVLTLDWVQDGDALVTVYLEVPFRIEFDQELDDEDHWSYLAYYDGQHFGHFDTLLEAEKSLRKKARYQNYKKGAKHAG
jgi:hypothetical protein